MNTPQQWFLDLQQQLSERIAEPVFLVIRVPYTDWFEVEIRTFEDRFGLATGYDLEQTIEDAVEMLLYLDEVHSSMPAH
jgi:hypothetical protein